MFNSPVNFLNLFTFALIILFWVFNIKASPLVIESLSAQEKCLHILNKYPESIKSFSNNNVIFKNNFAFLCDDGKTYNLLDDHQYQEQMSNADLSDMLLQEYPQGYHAPIFELNYSPGRIRNDQLFINTYIDISKLPQKHLDRSKSNVLTEDDLAVLARYLQEEIVKVNFLGFNINFNRRNGAAEALERVSEKLQTSYPQAAQWLTGTRNMSGGFNMRFISGTHRLSSHSWGVAVDFTLKNASSNLKWFDSYWKWVAECAPNLKCSPTRTDAGAKQRASVAENFLKVQIFETNFDHFPEEVINVFASEGFIWGGHWNHFDTMHFEYRPEFFN